MKKVAEVAQVNEYKVRLVAFFVFVLTIVYLYSNFLFIPSFLMIDFLLRSTPFSKLSLLGWLSEQLIKIFKAPFKPVYYPPKRFAARIGLVFSLCILGFHVLGWNAFLLSSVLMFFAFLESVFGFCAGCYVYGFFVRKGS